MEKVSWKYSLRCMLASMLVSALSSASSAQAISPDDALEHAKLVYSQQGARPALPEFEAVLESYRKGGNRRGEAITEGLIGNCYKRLGDYEKALSMLNAALAAKRELHDRPEEGKTLSHLGLVYWEQGQYPKAIDFFNQSIAIARELQDIRLEAAALNNLSLVFDEQGDYRNSLEQYQKALELHRSVKYSPGESDTLGNIGGVYLLLGRYSEAERYYRQALEISKKEGLKPSEAQDLGNLAQCLLGEGKIRDSFSTYDEAIALAHDAGLIKEEADWYRGKGSAFLKVGKFDDGLKNYDFALRTYSKAGLQRELIEVIGDMGNAYLALGDWTRAEKSFRQAVSISRKIDHKRGVVWNQLSLAETLFQSGNLQKAHAAGDVALADARKLNDSSAVIDGMLLMGRILRERGQLSAALQTTEKALPLARDSQLRLAEGAALDQAGELKLMLHRYGEALKNLDDSASIATASGDVDLHWKSEYHRGQVLERLKDEKAALEAYKTAVSTIESVRSQIREQRFRTGYLQDKQRVYLALVRLQLRIGHTGDAFEFCERLREYSFLSLRGAPLMPATPAALEAKARLRHLQEMIDVEARKPAAQQRSEALKIYSEELVEAQHQYEDLIEAAGATQTNQIVSISPERIREALAPGTALLEYVVEDNQLSVFVITPSGLRVVTQHFRERDLRSKVELLRDLVTDPTQNNWIRPAESLNSLLIWPVEQRGYLIGIRSLIVVPYGILNYLPFALLTDGGRTISPFLTQRYDIAEIPAASLLVSSGSTRDGSERKVVAFAPEQSGLRYAIPEARDVAKVFGSRADAVTGRRATESKFKAEASKYDIVHIATHGFFDKANPAFSGLQLEPDSENDGRLEVHEILGLRLKARLVTLSACDSALGAGDFDEVPAGDEFIGINRAFLEAGADAVLASLWKVNDRSTLVMMHRLYRDISRENPVHALAQTQRSMIRDSQYGHPYYWAAFIFVGRTTDSSEISAEKH